MSCIVLFTSVPIFLMGFMSGAQGGQSMSLTPAGCIAVLEPYMYHNQGVVKLGLDSFAGIKQSYSRHHYILQNVLILKTVLVSAI